MKRGWLWVAATLVACGGRTEDVPSGDASMDGASDGASDVAVDGGPGDAADLAACGGPGECVLVANGCCGPCGVPTLSAYTAVNEKNAAAFRELTCPSGDVTACPDCAVFVEKSLMALCEAGRCAPIDLRTHPFSACDSHDDCVLRASDCCECGGDTENPVALNRLSLGDYAAAVCEPSTGCPECAPVYPAVKPICDAVTKHCVVPKRG